MSAAVAARSFPVDSPPPADMPWHVLPAEDAVARLGVDPNDGLDPTEAALRLERYGPNELVERGAKSPLRIFWEQLTSVMILVLVAAGVLKAALGEYIDAGAILLIVLLNAILGFVQEYRAEQAMAALKKLAAPIVRVRRGGRLEEVAAASLVPGDIVLVEAGNAIPADARIVESANLRVQEASLTGESLPVEKAIAPIGHAEAALGDRVNMVYAGTAVTYGRGVAVVVDTGMRTELGRIAELLQNVAGGQTPLQERIKKLGIMLALGVLVVVAAVFLLGVIQGRDWLEMLLAGIAIAVAAIPEGLPAVLTITLALGAQRMLKRRALIRKLPAVETLGSVTTVCSDKTGTLTENKMKVKALDVAGHTADLTELMHRGHPVIPADDRHEPLSDPAQALLLAAGTLCNDAVMQRGEDGEVITVGDPTEGAIVVAAAHHGLDKAALDVALPREAEAPFSSERRRMTTVHRVDPAAVLRFGLPPDAVGSAHVAVTKGAPDGLLALSTRVWVNGAIRPMDDATRARIQTANEGLAAEGLRVLAVAIRPLEGLPAGGVDESIEEDLIFVGHVGMIDPPRPEVRQAVLTARAAGIRPVMITGDHPLTALQIAKELHIAPTEGGRVLTGEDLARMDQTQLEAVVEEVPVFARVAPEHKLDIVQALQRKGHIVAMTGDGVNDAPALRRADIGVAMGITGTDVSKEAADMVLTDDNFATIVSAVEEGRTIYDNVRKFVKYIVTSNTGEVTVMFLSALFGLPLPLTTLQILWMNLVTDGVPGLALGLEPTERDAMRRAPFAPGESIFSRGIGRHVVVFGMLLALVAFGVGFVAYQLGNPAWGTMVFVTLTLAQLGHAIAVRSNRESILTIGFRTNKLLLIAVVVTLVLQLGVVYLPFAQALFGTMPLTLAELGICLLLSTVVFWGVELEKWFYRRAEARDGKGVPVATAAA